MTTSTGTPELILVIRHGEKPDDPASASPSFGVDSNGNPDRHSLTPRGWQRSGALAVLFAPAAGPLQAGLRTPSNLFSPYYGIPAKTVTHRTYQTIQALSQRINVRIETPFAEGQEDDLLQAILDTADQTVLVCWEHHHIPVLAAAVPTSPGTAIPPKWPEDRFDLIWCFTRAPGATLQYTFSQIPQQLLKGDTDTIIA
ncbi:MAG: hypothetical protein ACRDQ4_04130 [Pseudonocardiaceae bacterium]